MNRKIFKCLIFLSVIVGLLVSCNGSHTKFQDLSPDPHPNPAPDPKPNPKPDPQPEDDPNADQHIKINITPETLFGQSLSQELPTKLGTGVDSRINFPKFNSCLLDMPVTVEDPVYEIYQNPMLYSQIASELNVGVVGNHDFGLISSSKAAQALRDTVNTEHTLKLTYGVSVKQFSSAYPINFGIKNLNDDSRSLLSHNESNFFDKCGDSFVYQAKRGAVFILTLSLNFDSASAKDYFIKYFNLTTDQPNVQVASVMDYISQFADVSKKNLVLTINAQQFGGSNEKLQRLLNPNLSCEPSNFEQCAIQIQKLDNYMKQDFVSTVDFNDKNSLHTFDYLTRSYGSLQIFFKTHLAPLSNNYQVAKDYIQNAINDDRRVYNFLVNYQNQPLMNNVDDATKAMLSNSVNNYKQMMTEYNHSLDMLQTCYADTNNLGSSCYFIMARLGYLRSKYQDFIDFAKKMSLVVSIDSTDGNQDLLIPIDLNNNCVNSSGNQQCYGKFALYRSGGAHGYFNNNAICLLDTTTDMAYFKNLHDDRLQGKLMYCTFQKGKIYSTYLKRNGTDLTKAISGTVFKNNIDLEVDNSVSADGYNAVIGYK